MAKELKDLTKRADNYSQWYNDLVYIATKQSTYFQSILFILFILYNINRIY